MFNVSPMKTKFILTLLTFNGIFLTTAIATASTPNLANLSQTISKSLDLDLADRNLVSTAIDRALLAKEVNPSEPKESTQPAAVSSANENQKPQLLGRVAPPKQIPKPKPSPNNNPKQDSNSKNSK